MIKTQDVESAETSTIKEWTRLQKEFSDTIYRCKEEMAEAQNREAKEAVFVQGMNDLIGLFKA